MGQEENTDTTNSERITAVERGFFAVIGRRRRPQFWSDIEVRRLLIVAHNDLTLDDAREKIAGEYGEDRVPGRSAIHRFWQSLDRFWKARLVQGAS